jgi:hypothetical protein
MSFFPAKGWGGRGFKISIHVARKTILNGHFRKVLQAQIVFPSDDIFLTNITKYIPCPFLFCIMWIDISTWALKICLLCQVRVSEYNNIWSQLNAINRKQTGRYGCFTNNVVFKFTVLFFLADRPALLFQLSCSWSF